MNDGHESPAVPDDASATPDLRNGERFWRSSRGIGLGDMLTEARRVLAAQLVTYPRLIHKQRISRFDAEHQTACMAAIVELLEANQGK